MSENRDIDRMVWSCSLYRPPEEDRAAQLEDALRSGDGTFWDDAVSLREYMDLTGISQAACARVLGRSQAGVANRLRLLRLPERARGRMRAAALTERHARALLRLEASDLDAALDHVIGEKLNVAETEAYVERCLARRREGEHVPAAFEPLLTELDRLRRTVPGVTYTLTEAGDEVCFIMRISKKTAGYL